MTFFLVVRVNFSEGGGDFRTFSMKNPSKMKKFFSGGGFMGQMPTLPSLFFLDTPAHHF